LGQAGAIHLSVHGPNDRYPNDHRFHVKVESAAAAAIEERGDFITYNLPRNGHSFNGRVIAPDVYRVARIRWLWDLQRPRFRQAAVNAGPLPDISDNRSGARLFKWLQPNDAADLDLLVSYDQPHWPDQQSSLRDNSRLGPLRNDAGMWLTATSYRRSQMKVPAPTGLIPPLPKLGEEPNRIMGGGPGQDDPDDMYWFVESITSREGIERSRPNANG
jgi:hypothetical protein